MRNQMLVDTGRASFPRQYSHLVQHTLLHR